MSGFLGVSFSPGKIVGITEGAIRMYFQNLPGYTNKSNRKAFLKHLRYDTYCVDCFKKGARGGHLSMLTFDHRARKQGMSIHQAKKTSFKAFVNELMMGDMVCHDCHQHRELRRTKKLTPLNLTEI